MPKKVLFIDRDGTLIMEPEDFQIDAFSKLEFYPKVFQYLSKIVKELDYELVMVTNQDGLSTASFPEETFWPVQQFIIKAFENEGITFKAIHIDKSLPEENLPTRKPGIGMLGQYLDTDEYDLKKSFVIGDRITDAALAKNLGAKAILINNSQTADFPDGIIALETANWSSIYEFLSLGARQAIVSRTTNETDISMRINLDGTGKSNIDTGIAFFDHMLEQVARHGQLDLEIHVKGDLHVDEHHTIEDTAIAFGEACLQALGNKQGIDRYGFFLPMDDCLAQVAIDFGGRNWLVWDAEFKREKIGEMPTEMFLHFFKSFADSAKANLNIKAEGQNEHHKIESIFKAFGKVIKAAAKRDPDKMILPTTKGIL